MSAEWIAWGQPVADQIAAGRIYLTYSAYVAFCAEDADAEEGDTEPMSQAQFQRAMIRRGLVLAPDDDLADALEIFGILCYPTAPKQRRKKR